MGRSTSWISRITSRRLWYFLDLYHSSHCQVYHHFLVHNKSFKALQSTQILQQQQRKNSRKYWSRTFVVIFCLSGPGSSRKYLSIFRLVKSSIFFYITRWLVVPWPAYLPAYLSWATTTIIFIINNITSRTLLKKWKTLYFAYRKTESKVLSFWINIYTTLRKSKSVKIQTVKT